MIKGMTRVVATVARVVAGEAETAAPAARRAAMRLGGSALPPAPELSARPLRPLSTQAGDKDKSPLAERLAARYGPGGALVDLTGSKPLSAASPPSAAQAALFAAGSPTQQRFDALVATAQARGEPVRTASVGVGRPGHDLAHMASELSKRGVKSEVSGFDVDAASVQHTRAEIGRLQGSAEVPPWTRRHLDGVTVHQADFAQWLARTPQAAGSLHAVTCASTTPYMDDATLTANLAAMHAALKPGGLAVIDGYGPGHDTAGKAMHLRSAAALEAVARQAGFEVVQSALTEARAPFETVRVFLAKPAAAAEA